MSCLPEFVPRVTNPRTVQGWLSSNTAVPWFGALRVVMDGQGPQSDRRGFLENSSTAVYRLY